MALALRRKVSIYYAFAAMTPKFFLAYSGWVWMGMFVNALAMVIFLFFWRAVYADTDTIAGLTFQQTLNYILLVQVVGAAAGVSSLDQIGALIRDGLIGMELLRPVDLQLAFYTRTLAQVAISLLLNIPLLLLAFAFGLHLPADPLTYVVFVISLLLGVTALFLYDWAFSCLAFFTTEVWGLMVLQYGVALFFSGALVPLVMMPDWLQAIASALPFAQALYVPVGFLSGTIPLAEAPQRWLIQIGWIVAMGLLSRAIFHYSVRKVTVQGG